MGFIRWLYEQYKAYELEQTFYSLKPNREEKEKRFKESYFRCREAGVSDAAILALMNLWSNM